MKCTGKPSDRDNSVPALLSLLQQWLWYNETCKLFFSKRTTGNKDEYYWFKIEIGSGIRTHGVYKVHPECIEISMQNNIYSIRELVNMRRYDILLIQFTNTNDNQNYSNWIGTDIPAEKGNRYYITPKI